MHEGSGGGFCFVRWFERPIVIFDFLHNKKRCIESSKILKCSNFVLPVLFLLASSENAVTGVALRSKGMILRPSRPQSLSFPLGHELKSKKC